MQVLYAGPNKGRGLRPGLWGLAPSGKKIGLFYGQQHQAQFSLNPALVTLFTQSWKVDVVISICLGLTSRKRLEMETRLQRFPWDE